MPSLQKTQPALRTEATSQSQDFFALRVTIVYHPNAERIGAFSDLLTWPATSVQGKSLLINEPPRMRINIGRQTPCFSDSLPLLEPHVSRAALRFTLERDMLGLEVVGDADCRVGVHAAQSLVVSAEQREAGLPIRLGHGVVLWLRQIKLQGHECTPAGSLDVHASEARSEQAEFDFDKAAASQHEQGGDAIPDTLLPGASIETQRLRRFIAAVAASHLPVMILGESGVGKELVAQAIHQQSARASRPMVTVNMAAIPEGLAASELFGAAKGAYTGAQLREGYFQAADGGTLFLDEIGDTPPTLQTQLLRALQQGEVQVVGGPPVQVDVRVIAATDAAIDDQSQFRHALRQRLSAFSIDVAPLRERLEDLGPIARQILARVGQPKMMPWSNTVAPPEVAAHWARLFFYWLCEPWPGNVREFSHQLQRAIDGDAWVAPILARNPLDADLESAVTPDSQSSEMSDAHIAAVYRASEFEVQGTADALKVSRQFLYRRIPLMPDCRLASDISDEELRSAVAEVGTNSIVLSRLLEVSARALRVRLNHLKLV